MSIMVYCTVLYTKCLRRLLGLFFIKVCDIDYGPGLFFSWQKRRVIVARPMIYHHCIATAFALCTYILYRIDLEGESPIRAHLKTRCE
jgi:hypothetical protein